MAHAYQPITDLNPIRGFWADFKAFIAKGNVLDLGVGIVIGAAFTKVVSSFVDDLLTPPIGLLMGSRSLENTFWVLQEGHQGGPYHTIADAAADGAVTINGGRFAMAAIDFLLVAFVLFWIVRVALSLRRWEAEEKKADAPPVHRCSECLEEVHPQARRCKYCTAAIGDGGERGVRA
ncbi:large conductance mechanosensitive channel protein [Thamnocephalis sphaerospora]|uniref:Large conductance mechanosensitive channel protein n=1 Tax=Thamnocephalis sphaerospora TaxID=78915 RepID=A0A4P9XQB9_9FUNG|nr:large conductance mechanosensitive channel protein [Thamnocephalis sphaerospora]|eukprot:RKP08102.1 large conductance mechanosensitive channel protein [Thamnocephalis sphaerospora]